MPHTYKLTYFNVRGLGEMIRMTFAQAGVKFEDNRLELGTTDWKPETPFGQLPVLEIDGNVKIAQSCAIARYIARQHGLAGKTPIEEAQVDSLADAFKDFINEILEFFMMAFGFVEGDKDDVYQKKVVPAKDKLFPALEKFLKESGSGFLVGKSIFEGHPEIPKWIQKVMDLPAIKKWNAERPVTKF